MPLWNCTEWGEEEEEEVEYAIHLAMLKYHEVGEYVVILAFALISGLAKLAFHHAHFVSSRVPESWSVLERLVRRIFRVKLNARGIGCHFNM